MSNGHSTTNLSDYPCWCSPAPDCCAVVNDNSTPATLSEGLLTVGGLEIIYSDIIDVTINCNADPVAQVNHFTPSGFTLGDCCGETETYVIELIKEQCDGDVVTNTWTLTYSETVTGAEIVDDFVATINADDNAFVTATDGNNTIILTADTAGCAFIVTYTTDNISQVNVVANVAPFGEASQVEDDGCTPLTSTTDYHAIDILYRDFQDDTDQCANCLKVCKKLCRVYVIDSAAGDSFITSVGDITDGTDTASKYLAKSGTLSCP
jgi:hypothetical protein